MSENPVTVRRARPEDAGRLLEIYAPYVENTTVTFETMVPSVEEFAGRVMRTLQKYPYLVAESGGEILGYAYAGQKRRGQTRKSEKQA